MILKLEIHIRLTLSIDIQCPQLPIMITFFNFDSSVIILIVMFWRFLNVRRVILIAFFTRS